MITLRDKDTGARLGSISEEELKTLVDALEEESSADTDYWIDAPTVDMLEQDGASAALVTLLRSALQGKDGLEVRWSRE
jgi:inactivated superfamily I helicase